MSWAQILTIGLLGLAVIGLISISMQINDVLKLLANRPIQPVELEGLGTISRIEQRLISLQSAVERLEDRK